MNSSKPKSFSTFINFLGLAVISIGTLLSTNTTTAKAAYTPKKVAIISAKEALLLEKPETDSQSGVVLPKGETVTIIDEEEHYYYISSGKERGYLKISDAKVIGTVEKFSKSRRAKTTADDVNLRAKPNASSNIITIIKKGSIIEISQRSNSWYKVYDGLNVGYVDCEYIEFLDGEETTIAYPTLKFGMSGKDVLKLQQVLLEKGFYRAEPEGTYGAKTREAVEKYQLSIGVSVDGVADETLQTKIYQK